MTGPHPAVAAARVAVRAHLAALSAKSATGTTEGGRAGGVGRPAASGHPLVLVACSGGADSLTLAAALAFEAPRAGYAAGAVVVDHGLQRASAQVAAQAAQTCTDLGLHAVEIVTVHVPASRSAATDGHRAESSDSAEATTRAANEATGGAHTHRPGVTSADGGPEARARTARYAALDDAATRWDARAVLLGHTRDDQAEQVLLGLARGSGARSLAGMAPVRGRYRRPLLGLSRAQTREACQALGLYPWADPHNTDERFRRVRARRLLERAEYDLGPGLSAALARSADLLRADADALDALADAAHARLGAPPWPVAQVSAHPRALRARLWLRLARDAGVAPGRTGAHHVDALDRLVTSWHGQGPVVLPGAVEVARVGDAVLVVAPRRVE